MFSLFNLFKASHSTPIILTAGSLWTHLDTDFMNEICCGGGFAGVNNLLHL